MLKSSWRLVRRKAEVWKRCYVARPTGHGKVKPQRITGYHQFMSRTDREALCRRLETV